MLKRRVRVQRAERALANLIQWGDEKEEPAEWDDLPDEDKQFAHGLAVNLIRLTDALLGVEPEGE